MQRIVPIAFQYLDDMKVGRRPVVGCTGREGRGKPSPLYSSLWRMKWGRYHLLARQACALLWLAEAVC